MHTQKDVGQTSIHDKSVIPTDCLKKNQDKILQLFKESMRQSISAIDSMPSNSVLGLHPRLLKYLRQSLDMGEFHLDLESLVIGIAKEHGARRSRFPSYGLGHIMKEYGILRRVIFAVLQEEKPLAKHDSEIIQECIQTALEHAAAEFQRLKDEPKPATEPIESRKILAEQESGLRLLINSLPQMVWTARPDGSVDWYNDWWYEYTGVDRSAFRHEQELSIHPIDLEPTRKIWKAALEAGESFEMQFRCRRKKDGQYRWHLGRGVPLREKTGKSLLWIGTNTDIHNLKILMEELQHAKEEAERSNVAKGSFLANMSHEIRTPLGAIIGFVDLLKGESLSHQERGQILDIMSRNGQSLTRIINDILDLAKVESGKMDIEKRDFSFPELLEEVVDLFSDQTQSKGIYLRLNIQSGVPGSIFSDQTRLRQILINIVGNAIKFTHEGGVTIDVHAAPEKKDRLCFTVKIRDTGIGISPKQKARLFQPFMQADSSTTRNFGGTGLGLALSKRLANALDGDIRLDAAEDVGGATFVITFLASIAPDFNGKLSGQLKTITPSIWGELPLHGLKILLADDAIDNQYLTQKLLSSKGAVVDLASNGIEALRMGLKNDYDLVLMDVQMPDMDGYEATRLLRKAGFDRPIIALTAHAMAEERTKSRNMGCDGHLTKPLNQANLVETIRQHVPKDS